MDTVTFHRWKSLGLLLTRNLQWMGTEIMAGKPKGMPKTGGRAAGTPNKGTQEFRHTVQQLLDDNRSNVALWLSQVANGTGKIKADPAKALDLLARLAEFAAPKLNRVEHAGEGGGPLKIEIVRYGNDPAP